MNLRRGPARIAGLSLSPSGRCLFAWRIVDRECEILSLPPIPGLGPAERETKLLSLSHAGGGKIDTVNADPTVACRMILSRYPTIGAEVNDCRGEQFNAESPPGENETVLMIESPKRQSGCQRGFLHYRSAASRGRSKTRPSRIDRRSRTYSECVQASGIADPVGLPRYRAIRKIVAIPHLFREEACLTGKAVQGARTFEEPRRYCRRPPRNARARRSATARRNHAPPSRLFHR